MYVLYLYMIIDLQNLCNSLNKLQPNTKSWLKNIILTRLESLIRLLVRECMSVYVYACTVYICTCHNICSFNRMFEFSLYK